MVFNDLTINPQKSEIEIELKFDPQLILGVRIWGKMVFCVIPDYIFGTKNQGIALTICLKKKIIFKKNLLTWNQKLQSRVLGRRQPLGGVGGLRINNCILIQAFNFKNYYFFECSEAKWVYNFASLWQNVRHNSNPLV